MSVTQEMFGWLDSLGTVEAPKSGSIPESVVIDRAKLIAARERLFNRQSDLAEYLGVAPSCVSAWELGARTPSVVQFANLLRALRIPSFEDALVKES